MGEEEAEDPVHGRETARLRTGDLLMAAAITALVIFVGMLLLSVRTQGDLPGEGRDVTEAVVTLAESVIGEFAPDNDTGAALWIEEPRAEDGCEAPLFTSWLSFSGGVEAALPEGTDAGAVLDHAEVRAEQLGLSVAERRSSEGVRTILRMRSGSGRTSIRLLLYEDPDGPGVSMRTSYSAICISRYRALSRAEHESLEQEWPGMIGFREGPLSEARITGQAAEQSR